MAIPKILTSLHGRLIGLSHRGALVINAKGRAGRVPLVLDSPVAASTAVSNTSSETAFDKKITVPANTLHSGSVIRVKFQGIATATNSTDTLAIKLYIGGTAGTALLSLAARDVANSDIFSGWFDLIIRTNGSSGTMVGMGSATANPNAAGSSMVSAFLASTAIDTTSDKDIVVSATWSVASASNSCRLDFLTAEVA